MHEVYVYKYMQKIFFNYIATCDDGAVRLSLDNRQPQSYELIADELARGRVEICSDGGYGTVCSDTSWNYNTSSVVCSQLGFSQYGKQ